MTRTELHTELCDIVRTKNKRKNIDSVSARLRELAGKIEVSILEHPGPGDMMEALGCEAIYLEDAGKIQEACEAEERNLKYMWMILRGISSSAATQGAALAQTYFLAGEFEKGEHHLRQARAAHSAYPEENIVVEHAIAASECAALEKRGEPIPHRLKKLFDTGTRWRPKRKARAGKAENVAAPTSEKLPEITKG